MIICHSFIDAAPWGNLFETFILEGWIYYLAVLILALSAAYLDRGQFSWFLLVAFILGVVLLASLQWDLARTYAHMRTGQLGMYCHSDNVDETVMRILQPEGNRRTYALQFALNVITTSLIFWLPIFGMRRLRQEGSAG